jgi:hypothetical protein
MLRVVILSVIMLIVIMGSALLLCLMLLCQVSLYSMSFRHFGIFQLKEVIFKRLDRVMRSIRELLLKGKAQYNWPPCAN